MGIIFQNGVGFGVSPAPTHYSLTTGWFVNDSSQYASSPGSIVVYNNSTNMGSLDLSLVGSSPAYSFGISTRDQYGDDQSASLNGLVGHTVNLILSWSYMTTGSVTFNCVSGAFVHNPGGNPFGYVYDPFNGVSPFGSLNLTASSGAAYITGPIIITYSIIS